MEEQCRRNARSCLHAESCHLRKYGCIVRVTLRQKLDHPLRLLPRDDQPFVRISQSPDCIDLLSTRQHFIFIDNAYTRTHLLACHILEFGERMHVRFRCPGSQIARLEPCEAMFNELTTMRIRDKPQVCDSMFFIDEARKRICDSGVVIGRGVRMRVRTFEPLWGTLSRYFCLATFEQERDVSSKLFQCFLCSSVPFPKNGVCSPVRLSRIDDSPTNLQTPNFSC